MLLVQPPGEGPFPPPIIRPPIVAASMSEVDLGSSCLYLGSGGACGKFATDQSTYTTTTTTLPNFSGNDTPTTPRHNPLGLFSKLRSQLSKSNIRANVNSQPTATNADIGDTDANMNPNTRTGDPNLIPSPDRAFLLPASTETALAIRPRAITQTSSGHGPVVSFASSPSFYSAAPANSSPSTFTTCSLEACSSPYKGAARSNSTPSLPCGSSVLSSPSLYSGDCGELSFYIGSSASFFAALSHGRDRRTGSEPTNEVDIDILMDVDEMQRGRPGFGGLAREQLRNVESEEVSPYSGIVDLDAEEQSTNSYEPYLPLVLQHERLQQRLQAHVSLDEVTSLSRSSIGSSLSGQSRAIAVSSHKVHNSPAGREKSKPRKHLPPPLRASSSHSRSRSRSRSNYIHPYAYAQYEPHSPTSTASSRSPITPRTPFFVSSDEDNSFADGLKDLHDGHVMDNDEEEDDDSGLSVTVSLNGRGCTRGKQEASNTKVRPKRNSLAAQVLPPFPADPPVPPAHIQVHILPPTPTLSGLVPEFNNRKQGANLKAHSPVGVIDAINGARTSTTPPVNVSPARSVSRAKRNSLNKPPPMLPPPSGPLPVPPATPVGVEGSRARVEANMHIDTLSPWPSPETSYEWPRHRHPSPFMRGSPSTVTTMLSRNGQTEEDDHEKVLDLAAEDSGIAFGFGVGADAEVDEETQSIITAEFFSAESEASQLSDDILPIRDLLSSSSSSSGSSDETEEHALLAANTRANATGGNFVGAVIGIGRRQVVVPKKSRKGSHRASKPSTGLEWTLRLGASSSSNSKSNCAAAHSLSVPSSAALKRSVSLSSPDLGPFSESSSSVAPGMAIAMPVFSVARATSAATTRRKRALAVPEVSVTPPADKISLRVRTKSESALGGGSKRRKNCTSGPSSTAGDDDWTLSLPLPSSAKQAKTTTRQDSDAENVDDNSKRTSVITVAGVEMRLDDPSPKAVVGDGDSELDEGDFDLYSSSSCHPVMEARPVIFSVPRVVSRGSGIESATRSKSQAKTSSPLEGDLVGHLFDSTSRATNSDANIAKLDILSADLARFNELLRDGKSLLEAGTGSERKGFLHDQSSISLGIPQRSAMPTQSRSGVRRTRSSGVLEIDEPPPKNAILRTPSVGHLFDGEDEMRRKPPTPSTTPAADTLPLEARAPVVISDTPIPSDSIQVDAQMPIRSGSPPPDSHAASSLSVVSTNSVVSVATIVPAKIRAPLPFASPPSAFGYAPRRPGSAGKVGSSGSGSALKPGLASGSALNPLLVKRSKSNGTSRSLRIVTSSLTPVASDLVVVSEQDVASGEVTPTNAFSSLPSFHTASTNTNPELESSTPSSTSTPADFHPAPSLISESTPTQSSHMAGVTRRPSSSSLSSNCSANLGSSSTNTPTSCLAYDSSAPPTPCASSFPIPPLTTPPSPFGRASGTYVAEDLGTAKAIIHQGGGSEIGAKQFPSRSGSVSSNSSIASGVGSMRVVAPNLEQRIRQLRMLGVDAAPPVTAVANSTPIAEIEAPSSKKSEKEAEVDAESVCSGPYYSARSSFSSER